MWERKRNTLHGLKFDKIEGNDSIRTDLNRFSVNHLKPITDFGVMGVGDDGGEPVQVVADGDFGDGQAFVSVEEAKDFAIDFFGGEGLSHILHGEGMEFSKVIGMENGNDDGVGGEGRAALGRGVEAFEVGDADGGLEEGGACSVFRFWKFFQSFGAQC